MMIIVEGILTRFKTRSGSLGDTQPHVQHPLTRAVEQVGIKIVKTIHCQVEMAGGNLYNSNGVNWVFFEAGGRDGVVEPTRFTEGMSCPAFESGSEKSGNGGPLDEGLKSFKAMSIGETVEQSQGDSCQKNWVKWSKIHGKLAESNRRGKQRRVGGAEARLMQAGIALEAGCRTEYGDEETQYETTAGRDQGLRLVKDLERREWKSTTKERKHRELKTDNPDVLQPQPGFIKTKEEQDYSFIKVEYNKWNTQRNKEGALMQLTTTYLKFFQVFQVTSGRQFCSLFFFWNAGDSIGVGGGMW
ncbi:hypothetical protein PPACK8108_LOCUS12141 [Phakopsora pachyrhizi]|uniref:Uncharacterized protein n=1 Tax=Phakopsora pachyrhizi TaxID=170000 RepID=A0AAV0B3T1_PHAPC|nr:hypothetical protein PPACK8108_LOCUS12141 [Phakopsora pachyrhizi]